MIKNLLEHDNITQTNENIIDKNCRVFEIIRIMHDNLTARSLEYTYAFDKLYYLISPKLVHAYFATYTPFQIMRKAWKEKIGGQYVETCKPFIQTQLKMLLQKQKKFAEDIKRKVATANMESEQKVQEEAKQSQPSD